MKDPQKQLPTALYASVIIVIAIYVIVAVAVVGNLALSAIIDTQGFALAEAMGHWSGRFGIVVISVTALFATASAVNATIYGSAHASYQIARDGELPRTFDRKIWKPSTREGLFITAALAVLAILFLDITKVTMLGSAAFLLLYAAVNAGHLRIRQETGAKGALVVSSLVACLVVFVFLSIYIYQTEGPATLIVMVALLLVSFAAEAIIRATKYRENRRQVSDADSKGQ